MEEKERREQMERHRKGGGREREREGGEGGRVRDGEKGERECESKTDTKMSTTNRGFLFMFLPPSIRCEVQRSPESLLVGADAFDLALRTGFISSSLPSLDCSPVCSRKHLGQRTGSARVSFVRKKLSTH
eukprot:762521-Hanusia_phi.AAC.1